MSISLESLGLNRLSVRERLELIEQIWDSLPGQVDPAEIPAWHQEELARRLAEADASPQTARPWRDALARYGDAE